MRLSRPLSRVLVTGGAGFIGSTLVRGLLARPGGTEVLNYDALTYAGLRESVAECEGPKFQGNGRYELVHADVTDAAALAQAIRRFDPEVLMHLAAESHVDRSIAAPEAFVRTNVEGTATVLRVWREHTERLPPAEREARMLVHVSTDEVYGSLPAGRAASVGDPYLPSSPYSATKAAADHLVRAYQRTYGLRSLIVCPTNNYGPRQFPEKLVPLATLRALRGEAIPLYGDGQQVRDWLHVEDCVAGLIAAAERGQPGQTIHLGASGEEWTNQQVVEAIADTVDSLRPTERPRRELIEHVADRPGHDRRYALDSSATHADLGWRPERDFAVGLAETVAWYAENPEWVAAATAKE